MLLGSKGHLRTQGHSDWLQLLQNQEGCPPCQVGVAPPPQPPYPRVEPRPTGVYSLTCRLAKPYQQGGCRMGPGRGYRAACFPWRLHPRSLGRLAALGVPPAGAPSLLTGLGSGVPPSTSTSGLGMLHSRVPRSPAFGLLFQT